MSGRRERATSAAYGAGWRLVRLLPEAPVRALFRAGGGWAAGRGGAGARRLGVNLRRVVGPDTPIEPLVRAGLQSYARYWYEAFKLPEWDADEIGRRFDLINADQLRAALDGGRGAIVALPHSANWDLAGAWAALNGFPVTTVAERLKPEDLYRRFIAFRETLGMEVLPLTGGDRSALAVLTERLRAGRLVVLLADRDLSRRGVEVDFFGERTKMPAGPAVLALRTGAPLFGLELWNDGPRTTKARLIGPLPTDGAAPDVGTVPFDVGAGPDNAPADVEQVPLNGAGPDTASVDVEEPGSSGTDLARVAVVTQRIADALAEGITAHPVDWHMLQPLWLADLPARTRRSVTTKG